MANLVDRLLKSDAKKVDELTTKQIKSKKLSALTGQDEFITIREIKSKRFNEIVSMQVDKKGNLDTRKLFDTKLIICTEGIIEPDLKSADLLEHFNCATPKDLVEKLFGNEVSKISDEITALSTVSDDDEDNEEVIKN